MDIKTYIQTVDGFEQWNPLMKGEFPMAKDVLLKEVFPAFQVEIPNLDKEKYEVLTYDFPNDLEKFLAEYKKIDVAFPVFHPGGSGHRSG